MSRPYRQDITAATRSPSAKPAAPHRFLPEHARGADPVPDGGGVPRELCGALGLLLGGIALPCICVPNRLFQCAHEVRHVRISDPVESRDSLHPEHPLGLADGLTCSRRSTSSTRLHGDVKATTSPTFRRAQLGRLSVKRSGVGAFNPNLG